MRDPMMSGYWAAPLAGDVLRHAHRGVETVLAGCLLVYTLALIWTVVWVCFCRRLGWCRRD